MLKKPMNFDTPSWTAASTLPGGDFEDCDFAKFLNNCQNLYPWLEESLVYDYARNYGTEIKVLLKGCSAMEDLGENFGGGLFVCEVVFLMTYEWAETAEDIIWRRSKKGLRMPEGASTRLQTWMDRRNSDKVA